MPQTKEVEDFLKSIGPFYEIAESEEEGEEKERATLTPNQLDDVTGETTNQSLQVESHDPNISADLSINNTGTMYL